MNKRLILVGVALAVAFVPASASAARSTQGSNYSEDWYQLDHGNMIKTCDMEADGRHVYAEFQLGTGEMSDVTDGNGANNECAQRGPYSRIVKHRTVEAVDFVPDNYGNWVYP